MSMEKLQTMDPTLTPHTLSTMQEVQEQVKPIVKPQLRHLA